MKKHVILLIAGAVAAIAAGCQSNSSSIPGSGPVYQQIERLSRPAVKEAFENFQNHDATNRSSPYDSTTDATLFNAIGTFETTVAGRNPAYGQTLQAVLIPDEMQADLSKTGVQAAYLGVETGGATGSKFGGRGLTSDVIAISLGAIFGTTLSDLGLVAPDGKQKYCLTNDNVSPSGKHFTVTFPYLGSPR